MDKAGIFAIALAGLVALSVALLSSGMAHFITGDSYSHALKVEKIAKGEAVADATLFHYFAAFMYSRAAAFSGGEGFDVGLLVAVLRFLPGLLALVAGVAAYFMLEGISGKEAAAACALLAVTSIAFVSSFMSNIVAPETLGFALFLCGAAFFLQALARKDWRLGLGAVLMGAAFLAWNGMVLAYAALALGAVAQAAGELRGGKGRERIIAPALAILLPLPFLAFANLAGLPGNFDAAGAFSGHFLLLPLLLLALLLAAVKAWGRLGFGENDALVFGAFIGSLAIAGYSALAALPGLIIAACFALRAIPEISKDRMVGIAVLGAAAAFAFLILLLGALGQVPALFFAIFAGAAAGFFASMYGGKRLAEYAQISVAIMLLLVSLSSAAIRTHYQADTMSPEMDAALAWVGENTAADAKLAAAGNPSVFAFIAQREAENDTAFVAGWLLGNSSASGLRERGIGYLVLDAGAFDDLEGLKNASGKTEVRIDSYLFARFIRDEQGNVYAAFYSQNGKVAYIPADEATWSLLPDADALLFDAGGNMRKVPVAKFVLLRNSEGSVVRAIYPYENYNVNLFNAYFGSVEGLSKAYPQGEGEARVFRVG